MIREMRKEDSEAVSRLHADALTIGFLSTLGENFLGIVYSGLIESGKGVVYVCQEDSEIVGFIAGSLDTRRLFREIYRNKFPRLAGHLMFKVVREPGIIRNLMRTSQYPELAGDSIAAELLSVAVKEEYRGGGIGRALVQALIDYFSEHGVDRFKVSVDRRLDGADRFYQRLGFELTDTMDIYGKKMDIYTYNLGAVNDGRRKSGFFESSDWDSYWQQEKEDATGSQRLVSRFRAHFGDEYVKHLKTLLPSDDATILEVGCGTAYCTQKMGDSGYGACALDYSPQAKRYWESKNVQFLVADGFRIPLRSDSFDVVWNAGVLEHFDNPRDMLDEMTRVAKPGGVVCIFVPYLFDITAHLKLYGDENIFTKKKLRELFSALDDVGVKVLYRTGGMIICAWGKKKVRDSRT